MDGAQSDKRNKEKDYGKISDSFLRSAQELVEMLSNHFYKENNILFPLSMRVFSDEEWEEVVRGFGDIGYCCFTPSARWKSEEKEVKEKKVESGRIKFDTGALEPQEIEGIFNSLPVDITFVDKNDTVRFYSESGGRILIRYR